MTGIAAARYLLVWAAASMAVALVLVALVEYVRRRR